MPKFLTTIPLPDLNTLVEVNLPLTGAPHDRGWWKRWFTYPVTVSWGSRTVETQGLVSQLPTTAMLPFVEGVLPRHESDISSSSCSAPNPVK